MIVYNNNDPRQTLIWSELYSAADEGGGIIADADYIRDRTLDKTQGLINSSVNSKLESLIARQNFKLECSFDKTADPNKIFAKIYRMDADGQNWLFDFVGDNLQIWYKFKDSSGEYLKNGSATLVYNDIPYTSSLAGGTSWKNGVSVDIILNKVSGASDVSSVEILLKSWDGILLDSGQINLLDVSASPSLNFEVALSQDIQNIFNMEYTYVDEPVDNHGQ